MAEVTHDRDKNGHIFPFFYSPHWVLVNRLESLPVWATSAAAPPPNS